MHIFIFLHEDRLDKEMKYSRETPQAILYNAESGIVMGNSLSKEYETTYNRSTYLLAIDAIGFQDTISFIYYNQTCKDEKAKNEINMILENSFDSKISSTLYVSNNRAEIISGISPSWYQCTSSTEICGYNRYLSMSTGDINIISREKDAPLSVLFGAYNKGNLDQVREAVIVVNRERSFA